MDDHIRVQTYLLQEEESVIIDDHQYQVTKHWAERFKATIDTFDPITAPVPWLIAMAYLDGVQSQYDEMIAELRDYEYRQGGLL